MTSINVLLPLPSRAFLLSNQEYWQDSDSRQKYFLHNKISGKFEIKTKRYFENFRYQEMVGTLKTIRDLNGGKNDGTSGEKKVALLLKTARK